MSLQDAYDIVLSDASGSERAQGSQLTDGRPVVDLLAVSVQAEGLEEMHRVLTRSTRASVMRSS